MQYTSESFSNTSLSLVWNTISHAQGTSAILVLEFKQKEEEEGCLKKSVGWHYIRWLYRTVHGVREVVTQATYMLPNVTINSTFFYNIYE